MKISDAGPASVKPPGAAMENVRMEVSRPVKDAAHNPLFTQDQPALGVRIDNGIPTQALR